jgi:hypothetical protein
MKAINDTRERMLRHIDEFAVKIKNNKYNGNAAC